MFRRVSIRLMLQLGDLAIVMVALVIASWIRPHLTFGKALPESSVWLVWPIYLLMLIVWAMGFSLLNVYNLQKNLQMLAEIPRLSMAHLISTLAFAGVLYFSFRDVSRLQVLSFAVISLFLLIIYRITLRVFLRSFGDKRYGIRRVLIIGAGSVGQQVAEMVIKSSWTGFKLVGFVADNSETISGNYPLLGSLSQTRKVVQTEHINEVVFALPRHAHRKLANLVTELEDMQLNMRVVPDFLDLVFLRSVVEDFGGIALVTLREPALDPLQRLTKRTFDLSLAVVGLLLTFFPMAIIALLIKLDSSGSAVFTQQRVGEYGRLFKMYKFRTMVDNAESPLPQEMTDGGLVHKIHDDPRITRIGRFLRRTSLDELPQLFNVLKGEMSLVGPRPELPWLVDHYERWQRKRFEVPQGMTGWWQVNGRSEKLMHLHTEEDLYYIKNYSLWLDFQILWRTIKVVINQRGAF